MGEATTAIVLVDVKNFSGLTDVTVEFLTGEEDTAMASLGTTTFTANGTVHRVDEHVSERYEIKVTANGTSGSADVSVYLRVAG